MAKRLMVGAMRVVHGRFGDAAPLDHGDRVALGGLPHLKEGSSIVNMSSAVTRITLSMRSIPD